MINQNTSIVSRVVGLDSHPDLFTAALLEGATPAQATLIKIFDKVPIAQLSNWAKKNTTPEDVIVLEASGNSFQISRTLTAINRKALVLESCQMGKLKDAHANNDKISAIRIGKAYLAGTAKRVWVPDIKTQERRDWFLASRKVVKRTTQLTNRLLSYLSDNGVRLPKGKTSDQISLEDIQKLNNWSPRQTQVIEGILMEKQHANEQRKHWESLMAQEVISDPVLLSMVRLCGVRDKVAFALGAIIGDINRFENPKKLVNYIGLNPAYDDSGNNRWEGGIGRHGRSDLRSLLIESAHCILRTDNSLSKWGRKLLASKGEINLVIAAMARKLTVAIWYLMMGRWTPIEEIDDKMDRKIGKIITHVGPKGMKALGKNRKELRGDICRLLKEKLYVVHSRPSGGMASKEKTNPCPDRKMLLE